MVKLATFDRKKKTRVEAAEVSPGLVVHRGLNGGWTVTHKRSGLAVWWRISRRADAVRLARWAAPFVDWDKPRPIVMLALGGPIGTVFTKIRNMLEFDCWVPTAANLAELVRETPGATDAR